VQGGADTTARNRLALQLEWRHDGEWHIVFAAKLGQQAHIAASVAAEVKVGALDERPGLKPLVQHFLKELLGTQAKEVRCGVVQPDAIDATLLDERDAIRGRSQNRHEIAGAQELERMRLQCDDDGRSADGIGFAEASLENKP